VLGVLSDFFSWVMSDTSTLRRNPSRFDKRVGDSIRLAEWSKGLFSAVLLNNLSVGWFRRSMEELRQAGRGDTRFLQDFPGGFYGAYLATERKCSGKIFGAVIIWLWWSMDVRDFTRGTRR
jgi:hypothetical protein